MKISKWKIVTPVLLGLGVAAWMIVREVDMDVVASINFTLHTFLFILLAFVFMAGRDIGYMWRLRLFARGELTWKQAFRVIMLWEFTSAITPSTVGGTAVAVVYVHKEGVSVGKSAAVVMLTAFFDELFFTICFPLIIMIVGWDTLFGFEGADKLLPLVFAGYGVKALLTFILSFGLFFNPRGLGKIIVRLFSIRLLKRWKEGAVKTADDLILSSREIKKYRFSFWLKAFLATSMSWISRFLVANAIIMAFVTISDQLLVFGRQLTMWIPMIISPTPGGAGFAEYIFDGFLGDIISVQGLGMTAIIALLWRCITFYPYLLIGILIVPRWLATQVAKKKSK